MGYARNKPELAAWINALLARRPARVVTVAVANKLARIALGGDEAWRYIPPGSFCDCLTVQS